MKTKEAIKSIEIITLDAGIMDCFDSNEDLAVITGGKGILDVLKEIIGVNGNGCNTCNGNCGC